MKEQGNLREALDQLRELIREHRAGLASAALWTLNSDDPREQVLASRAAIQLRLEMLELSSVLNLLTHDIQTVILGRHSVPVTKGARKNNSNRPRRKARVAFDVGDTERGRVIVRVEESAPVRTVEHQFGDFPTWTEANAFAAKLNKSCGIRPREAEDIIIASKLFHSETVSQPDQD